MLSMETIVTSSCLLLPASACTGTIFQFAAPNSFTNAELVLVACCLFFFPLRTGVRDLVSVSVCLCLDSLSIYVFYCECIFEDLFLLFFKAFVFPPAFLETLFFLYVCVCAHRLRSSCLTTGLAAAATCAPSHALLQSACCSSFAPLASSAERRRGLPSWSGKKTWRAWSASSRRSSGSANCVSIARASAGELANVSSFFPSVKSLCVWELRCYSIVWLAWSQCCHNICR